jgi:hypothetical protein
MYCKVIVPDVRTREKRYSYFSAARFIVSERLMTRNYPGIITYALM